MNIYVTTFTWPYRDGYNETKVYYTIAGEEESIAHMHQIGNGMWYAYSEEGGWSQGSREYMEKFIKWRISVLLPSNAKLNYIYK